MQLFSFVVLDHRRGLLVIISYGVLVMLMMLRIGYIYKYDARNHMIPLGDLCCTTCIVVDNN